MDDSSASMADVVAALNAIRDELREIKQKLEKPAPRKDVPGAFGNEAPARGPRPGGFSGGGRPSFGGGGRPSFGGGGRPSFGGGGGAGRPPFRGPKPGFGGGEGGGFKREEGGSGGGEGGGFRFAKKPGGSFKGKPSGGSSGKFGFKAGGSSFKKPH